MYKLEAEIKPNKALSKMKKIVFLSITSFFLASCSIRLQQGIACFNQDRDNIITKLSNDRTIVVKRKNTPVGIYVSPIHKGDTLFLKRYFLSRYSILAFERKK